MGRAQEGGLFASPVVGRKGDRQPGKASPERVVEAAFEFLLDREPKESILRSFDVNLISGYFPAFDSEIGSYL